MPRVSPAQNNFTAGEISPRLLGREDVARYGAGAAILENFRTMPHGGVTRRPGWQYVAETKSSNVARLFEFEQSVDAAYVIEATNLFFRFYRNSGQILSLGVPYEIATPYLTADLFELQMAQTADVMYIANRNYWPRKLTRTGDTSWTLTSVSFTDGPYLPNNATSITMTPSAATGAITITASSAYFVSTMAPVGTEPGALIRIKVGANPYGYARITGYVSPTVVNATVLSTFTAGGVASAVWAEGAWSTYRGFPRSVTFFEQRLYFGGTSYQPQTLWGSAVAAYEDFTPGTTDVDPVTYTIASRKMNAIQWLRGRDVLFIGTAGAEYTAGDPTQPLTPTNVRIIPQTSNGSMYLPPVETGNVLLFTSRSKRKVREMSFDFRDNSYRAPDNTILAEHITRPGLKQMAFAAEPDGLVFAVRTDGQSPVLTYDKEQEVVAWTRDTTQGEVESVACIPVDRSSGTEGYYQSWRSVKRIINGVTKRFVEFEAEPFDESVDIEDAFFVDCGLRYSGAATAVFTGLDHLEGMTVAILGNGAVHPPQVVTAGQVSLSYPCTSGCAGLPYTSTLQTLPGIVGSPDGTAQGKKKRWSKLKARLHRTVGLLINQQRLSMRTTGDAMTAPVQPFTGIKEVQSMGWDEEARVTIIQDQPLPATILSLFGTQSVEDQ